MPLQCPGCGSKDVRRSRNDTLLSSVMRRLVMHPFRCRSCRKRFFRSGPIAAAQTSTQRMRRFGYVPLHQNLGR